MTDQAPNTWLERLPLAAGAIRDGRFSFVNAALAELVGYSREAMTGMSFLEPVAEEHRSLVRDRHARRLRGEAVTGTYEFDVVRSDATRRRVEIWVVQVGRDTLFQLHDRTEAAEHAKKLWALAHLGAAVQAEQTRPGVLAKIDDGAAALGFVAIRMEARGDSIVITSYRRPGSPGDFEGAVGVSVLGQERPWTPATRQAWRDGISYVDDLPSNAQAFFADAGERTRDFTRQAGWRRAAFLRIDEGGRPSHLLLLISTWLQPDDVPTLSLFATQITAALAAARAIADLSKRNDELAALNRLATAAGTMRESKELFAGGGAMLAEAIGCLAISFYLIDEEAGVAVLAHQHGGSDESRERYARLPLQGTRVGETARCFEARIFYPGDFEHDPTVRALLASSRYEAVVLVPLIARAAVIGVMNVAFGDAKAIGPRVVEFLKAAAPYFAAAIEANRLLDDLRRSYANLSRAQEQLVHTERLAALGEMAAVVAHEVRNPLGVIFNAVGSLRKALPEHEGDAAMLVGIVAEEAARLNDIVGDLLDFARPVRPDLQPASLTDVVRDALDTAVATAGSRIDVDLVTDGRVPSVPLDARLVRQAVINIALNAVQGIAGNGEIRVRISSVERDGGTHARVEISDSGPGIPPDVLPRVFEPFFTTRPKGTGLGLAVVKGIMDGHRGRVSVSSEPGSPTTFAIEFPAA